MNYPKRKLGRPLVEGANRISKSWRISEKLANKLAGISKVYGVEEVEIVRVALEKYEPNTAHFEHLKKERT